VRIKSKNERTNISKRMKGNKYSLGFKHTEETKEKMSRSHIGWTNALGYKHTKYVCKNISKRLIGNTYAKGTHGRLGKPWTDKERKKLSLAAMGKHGGKLNGRWLGGLSFGEYSCKFTLALKRKIRKRDKNICQLCDKRKYGEELAVHHIDYNKKNCDEVNLISLHRRCNTKVNANRGYWMRYFKKSNKRRILIWVKKKR